MGTFSGETISMANSGDDDAQSCCTLPDNQLSKDSSVDRHLADSLDMNSSEEGNEDPQTDATETV